MLAAVFTGEGRLNLQEVPVPECPPGGLLIDVKACAICGTDIKTLRGADVKLEGGKQRRMPLPRILGHEFAGVVRESDSQELAVGTRVVVAPTVPCGQCEYCRRGYAEMCDNVKVFGYDWDGGFSEVAAIDASAVAAGCVVPIPDGVDFRHASIAEPMSCAMNCLELSPVTPGDTVAVIGAGPLGVILTDLAKLRGASRVILAEWSQAQIEAARVSRADEFINTQEEDVVARVKELTNGRGVDLLIIACSAPAAQSVALDMIAKRGKINLFAGLPRGNSMVTWDTNIIHYTECTVTGTHGSRPEHVRAALELVASGEIDAEKIISRTFTLANIQDAIETAQGTARLKVIVTT